MELFIWAYGISAAFMLFFVLSQFRILWQLSDNIPAPARIAIGVGCVLCPVCNTILTVALVAAYIRSYWT